MSFIPGMTGAVAGAMAGGSAAALPIVISSDVNNVNLRTLYDALYPTPDASTVVECTIESGVIIGSASTANPSFDVGSWPVGATLRLILAGGIRGPGGDGGTGSFGGSPGSPGGTALYTRFPLKIDGTGGTLYGGGGGGGGGSGASNNRRGGGGGAGRVPGNGGTGSAGNGSAGTLNAGGPSGGGNAGDGGNPGQAGENASDNAGGAAGNAIDGDSYVTLTVSPTILGPRVN